MWFDVGGRLVVLFEGFCCLIESGKDGCLVVGELVEYMIFSITVLGLWLLFIKKETHKALLGCGSSQGQYVQRL